jgi:hypothetical protein
VLPHVRCRVVGHFFFVGRIEKIEGYDCGIIEPVGDHWPGRREVQQKTTVVTLLVIV